MQPALVVIVNNQADWQRVEHEGWYRIPKRSAPLPLAADVLAFYFTSRSAIGRAASPALRRCRVTGLHGAAS